MIHLGGVTKHLLGLNILMFIASKLLGLENYLALYYWSSDLFQPYQIVTHFFMHANLPHLFFNMFALISFGTALEARLGSKRFLLLYIVSALAAALLHMGVQAWEIEAMREQIGAFGSAPDYETLVNFFGGNSSFTEEFRSFLKDNSYSFKNVSTDQVQNIQKGMSDYLNARINVPMVGASGAVFGILVAFGMLFPDAPLQIIFLPMVSFKAKYFIPFLLLVELFLGTQNFQWDNIAHYAHLGGAIAGFLMILYWRKKGNFFQR